LLKKIKLSSRSTKLVIVVLSGLVIALTMCILYLKFTPELTFDLTKNKMSYHTNIIKDTAENTNFRKVLFTGLKSQLVVMSIPPGGEVGEEIHKYTEQTLFFLSGTGVGTLNDEKFPVGPGDVVVVVPGTKHNFINTGKQDLKIYTVYAPPNHIDGRIHKTKADADLDTLDEAVGESAPVCKA